MAVALRSVMANIFREAIVEEHISLNPVEPTPKVKREHLVLDQDRILHSTAEGFGEWVQRAFELALVTGQRREDISLFRFSDIRADRLFIEQQKTGHKLALPLGLKLGSIGPVLGDVINNCRTNNPSDLMLYSSVRRGGRKPAP